MEEQTVTPPPPPVSAPEGPEKKENKGLALAAMILGLIGLVPVLGLIPGIIGLILGIVALCSGTVRKGMAITGVVCGSLGLLIILSSILLVPAVGKAKEMASQAACTSNLSSIGTAIEMYQMECNGEYPESLELLIEQGTISREQFRCPSVRADYSFSGMAYFYLPPAKGADPRTIVMCDYQWNHNGEVRMFLRADGTVGKLREAEFQAELTCRYNKAFAEVLEKADHFHK